MDAGVGRAGKADLGRCNVDVHCARRRRVGVSMVALWVALYLWLYLAAVKIMVFGFSSGFGELRRCLTKGSILTVSGLSSGRMACLMEGDHRRLVFSACMFVQNTIASRQLIDCLYPSLLPLHLCHTMPTTMFPGLTSGACLPGILECLHSLNGCISRSWRTVGL